LYLPQGDTALLQRMYYALCGQLGSGISSPSGGYWRITRDQKVLIVIKNWLMSQNIPFNHQSEVAAVMVPYANKRNRHWTV
jgi:hypothetical protein